MTSLWRILDGFGLVTILLWAMTGSLPAQPVGTNACASCHPAQSNKFSMNGMSRALLPATESNILRRDSILEFSEGQYRTKIASDAKGPVLTVRDGTQQLAARIQWAFGLGRAGQTYVFEHEGALYESRVSYYDETKGLDLTMGAHGSKPNTLLEAAGRRMDAADVREYFGCHSTGGIRKDGIAWNALTPGITCENCHGNASEHLKARKGGKRVEMRKLSQLSAEEMNDLCGACHRTWAQVAEMKIRGPLNVRFQPYRITNSKCFDGEDRRIGCTTCHDPHSELATAPGSYDASCRACHATAAADRSSRKSKKICPTGKSECVSCHMPKIALPGSHFEFTDHQIRVVRSGEAYPN